MEENTAILIADLAGYTALTETHGPASAADMIDKFRDIVNASLVGESVLHQCIGDEVLIVSSSPDHLLSTASVLIQNCSKEHLFLQVHGGLHYGKVLKRNNHYFGSPINLTSRIAGKANKGAFWCSSDFINELANPAEFRFASQGKHSFKNVSEEIDVFELIIQDAGSFHVDPVCRMLIHEKKIATPHPHEENIFFCSPDCLDIYIKQQEAF